MTSSILDAYRLPQLVQGWEWGLLRFVRARVTSTCHHGHPWQSRLPSDLLHLPWRGPLVLPTCAWTLPASEGYMLKMEGL